jgi:hypothetical protein
MYVSVGDGDYKIAISNDGILWQQVETTLISYGNTIAWNGNLFVLGGDNLLFSYTGISWEESHNTIMNYYNKIIWGSFVFIAMGTGVNSIGYSYDGVNWLANGTSIFSEGFDVIYNNDIFLALGTGTYTLATSTNGNTWSGSLNTFFTTAYNGIWDGSQFIIIGTGNSNQIAHSSDGLSFSLSTNIFDTQAKCISYNGQFYIALGSGSFSIAYSNDSYIWVGITSFSISNPKYCFWDGNKYIIGAEDSTHTLITTTDGINYTGYGKTVFTVKSSGVECTTTKQRHTILFDNSTTGLVNIVNPIVIGFDSIDHYCLYYSYDAHEWTPVNTRNLFTSVKCIHWSGKMWLVATDSSIYYSFDLLDWHQCSNASATDINDICYNGNCFIALKTTGIDISYDGIYWRNVADLSTTTFKSCLWTGSFFIAVGLNTDFSFQVIFKSYDGIIWENSNDNPFLAGYGNDICWTGTTFIAVGSGLDNNVAVSNDGINWFGKGLITTTEATTVCTNGSIVIVGNATELFYSSDQGDNWNTLSPLFNVGLTKLSFQNNRFIAVGESSHDIAYSFDSQNWYYERDHSLFSGDNPVVISKSYDTSQSQMSVDRNLYVTTEFYQYGYTNFFMKK